MTDEDRQTLVGLGSKLVDSFKTSPMLLALVILNMFVVGGILWSVREERAMRVDVTKSEQQIISDMARLLAVDCPPR